MKKTTFERIQKRYSNMCNLYWFRLKALYNESGLTKVNLEQIYAWEKKDKEIIEYKTVMDELFYICCLEGNESKLNNQPTAKLAKEFRDRFYIEIYQTEG